ncbi:rubisco accumulation factor 1.2, chloroplastic-like [Glycine soja]|uniref:rubisco accumulation factor 1.2, chloroplastic-like n=1 Tax=Glycine soja TaxID=3848 RepID=UPI00103FF9B5|nr:rubisco accumulation factor 1.2, chloroplastic-like [Glycine soja]KAG4982696.1 hypothetical protein JHK87_027445 [Glycine soja]
MWLDLSDNALEVISSTFGNLSLEYLDLSLIKFEGSTFPEFGAFKSLKTLNLSNNMLVGESNADSDLLVAFKTGAELLYEIRLLSAFQCITVARFLVENRCDGKATQELARAMKDFPSRHGDKGWESFDYTLLEDCLSFMYYRQSREHRNPSKQRTSVLE